MNRLQRVLIVGAGLIGGSMGLALSRRLPHLAIDAVECDPAYREEAARLGAFRRVWHSLDGAPAGYDLAVLAVPVDAAIELLPRVRVKAAYIMDVCSVKRPIVEAIERASLGDRGVPSHPMAGKAQGGPGAAEEGLFEGRPWIFLASHRPPAWAEPLVQELGAHPVYVADADQHDAVLASASHGIHLASQCAMLAAAVPPEQLAAIAGPGFWDITRLASSPSGFWVDTLCANRDHVIAWLRRFESMAGAFRRALETENRDELRILLDEARQQRQRAERANATK